MDPGFEARLSTGVTVWGMAPGFEALLFAGVTVAGEFPSFRWKPESIRISFT